MSNEEKKFLADVIMAIENIDVHLQGKRDYNLFQNNITIRSAVKYEFSIIGEGHLRTDEVG